MKLLGVLRNKWAGDTDESCWKERPALLTVFKFHCKEDYWKEECKWKERERFKEGGTTVERKMESGIMRGKPQRVSKRSEDYSNSYGGHFPGIQGSVGTRW